MRNRNPIPSEMRRVAGRIATWRAERERVEPMPEELWRAAIDLAGEYGVGPTARGLKIDFGGLQRRVERERSEKERAVVEADDDRETEVASTAGCEPLQFVELPGSRLAPPVVVADTTVEVTRPDGTAMTVRIAGDGALDVGVIVESFLRQ